MNASVVLLNRSLAGFDAPQYVQGLNQEQIGISKFDTKYGCHSLTITLEQYEKFAKAIAECSHLAMRRWEPHFVVEPLPEAVQKFWDGYNLGLAGFPKPSILESPESTGIDHGAIAYWQDREQKEEEAALAALRVPDTFPTAVIIAAAQDLKKAGVEMHDFNPLITGSGDYANAVKSMTPPKEPEFEIDTARNADLNVPFFSLKKIAKNENVDISVCENVEQIRAAITKHRFQPA